MKLFYLHGTPFNFIEANNIQVFNMCQAFSDLGVQVTLGIPESTEKNIDPTDYVTQLLGCRPYFRIITYKKLIIAGRLQMLGNYFGARALLRKTETDLCFVRDPLILKTAMDSKCRLVFEVHNSSFHYSNMLLNKMWEHYVIRMSKKNNMVKFVTISKALEQFWREKGVPESKLLVAHDGFSPHLFSKERQKIEARALLGLPKHQKIVVYAGSLYADRNVERIISLANRFPRVLFVVVGGSKEQAKYYSDLSNKADVINVSWKGFVPHADIPVYLQAADVLLMLFTWKIPTIRFCSPLKVFEYMAAGRIIVGEAFPTITEVLKHNYTAFLAKPDSFKDLSKNLSYALSEVGTSEMARLAREQAFKKYSWENRAKNILNSIDGLI